MTNQSFSHSSLARCLYSKDFFDDPNLANVEYRKTIISNAVEISNNPFPPNISIKNINLGSKTGYSTSNLSEKLVLRKCVENIKSQNFHTHTQRSTIGKQLAAYLKEGTPYRIYRLDIKSFFESIDCNDIKNSLSKIDKLSTHTKNIIFSYLDHFNKNNGKGIPRGIEISPIISEVLMMDFDKKMKLHDDIFYYARFVDDILIITSSHEEIKHFTRWVKNNLPKNLNLNQNKKFICTVKKRKRSLSNNKGTEVAKFDFLGYEFTVIDTKLSESNKNEHMAAYRKVIIDLSTSKTKKIKTKISQAFYNNYKKENFNLLYDRISFLVTNRELRDKERGKTIPTGIYYNYSIISPNSAKLESLDAYLKSSILYSKNRLGKTTHSAITANQRKKILKLSFKQGFKKRTHKKFSPNRLKEITKIW